LEQITREKRMRPPAEDARTSAQHQRPPNAEAVIRTVPMPSDCNPNGDIFGGWVLSQMDVAGGIVAYRRAQGRVVTVGVNAMTFHQPIRVGDVVAIYAWVKKVGRTSVAVEMQTVVSRRLTAREIASEILVTEGTYTYVAIDEKGRPRPVPGE
jgi:acyl-CoA thioesterase YciA